MVLELHLCGPKGDALIEELNAALALVQRDNEFLIQAMLRSGRQVPEVVEDMGIVYRPPSRSESLTDRQAIRGLRSMLEQGYFSCGDAAPWEAAVLRIKYGVAAVAFSKPLTSDGLTHGIYRTPSGVIDPVARYLAKTGREDYVWEALT